MLAAVEAWTKRNHDAEWKEWESWLGTIREKVASIPGVETQTLRPRGPSNYAPQLRISWNAEKLGVTGFEIQDALLEGDPRIVMPGQESSVTVMPYMMNPGDDRVVAPRLYELLTKPPRRMRRGPSSGVSVTGQWDAEITFVRGEAKHTLFVEQRGERLAGTHRGEFLSGDLVGSIDGERVTIRSSHRYEGTSLGYVFEGKLEAGVLRGKVDLGEYGKAEFVARRHVSG